MNCVFCGIDVNMCQVCALSTCNNPICYNDLEIYWKFNKDHDVTIGGLTTK